MRFQAPIDGASTQFWLGVHHPNWLATAGVPLFVSRRTLADRKTLPQAAASWALDSGGFTELSMYGEFQTSAKQYAAEISRFEDGIGRLDWAAPQDWMCEPVMLKKTGLNVFEHQSRTVRSFLELRDLGAPVIPVLQGWVRSDYERCIEMYEAFGVDLQAEPVVGLGSVCRRSSSLSLHLLLWQLSFYGLRLHGFGLKGKTFVEDGALLASADSMAWSYRARREAPYPGHSHKNCANCLEYALDWRTELLDKAATHRPLVPEAAA